MVLGLSTVTRHKAVALLSIFLFSVGYAKNAQEGEFPSAFSDMGDEDPVSFVQTVNQSMAKDEDKLDDRRIHTLYRINQGAVRGAAAAERKNVLAEIYATAPVKCLPYFTDMLAKEVFARSVMKMGPKDEAFLEFASAALVRVSMRCRRADNLPNFRMTFAVIMFLKAAEGQPEDIRETLMGFIPSGLHEISRKEWLPAVMGDDGKRPTYQPMMEAEHRREVPDHDIIAGSEDPAELRNWLYHSEMPVVHDAYDVQAPKQVSHWREIPVPGGNTLGAGLGRAPHLPTYVPRDSKRPYDPNEKPPRDPCCSPCRPCPDPYLGQTL